MAVTHVQSANVGAWNTSQTSATITFASAATANNLLVACIEVRKTVAFATPSGWTLLEKDTGTGHSCAVFYKVAAGGEANVTITWDLAYEGVATFSEYSGLDAISPLDASTLTAYASGTTHQAASQAPSSAPGLAVVVLAGTYGQSMPAISVDSGFTIREQKSTGPSYDPILAHADVAYSTTSALAPIWTSSVPHAASVILGLFKEPSGGGGPTLITSTDTLAPSLTESQASFLESSLSDVLTTSVSDAVQLLKNPEFVAVSDALSISVAEAVSLLGGAIVSDALTPSIGDLASLDTGGAINVNVTDALTPTLSESQQSTLYAAVLDALSLSLGEEQGSLLFSGVTDVVPLSVSESVSLLVAHTATDTLVVSITDLSSVATFNTIAKAVSDALAPYFDLVGGYEVRSLWADKAAAVSVWVAATPDAATWTDATPKTDTWSDVE